LITFGTKICVPFHLSGNRVRSNSRTLHATATLWAFRSRGVFGVELAH
jgi:hypothetical protein